MSWKDGLSDEEGGKLKKRWQPGWIGPMLATLTDDRFSREDWIFERKLDGERCLAFKKGKGVRLMSRNKKEISRSYPELAEALEKEDGDFVVDGEIVTFDGKKTSFAKLQPRMHAEEPDMSIPVYYYVFDIMHYDGYDLQSLPLESRKSVLNKALDFKGRVRYMKHRREEGERYYKEACRKGWEGIIAKDATYKYVNSRSRKWLKFKCVKEQEFVIVGFTDPQGSRKGFGALLVGYYDGGELKYAGKVGTGYSDQLLEKLGRELKGLEQEKKPVEGEVKEKGAHWVKPKLVGEVKFTEWTDDGKLRHPAFKGLRRDKEAKKVVREDK